MVIVKYIHTFIIAVFVAAHPFVSRTKETLRVIRWCVGFRRLMSVANPRAVLAMSGYNNPLFA